ncbi:MAG: hypothetical protein WC558_12750 [Patulibacter sp.]
MAAAVAAAGLVALAGASSANALNVGTIGTPIGSGSMASTSSGGPARLVYNTGFGQAAINCTASTLSTSIATGAYALPATVGTGQLQFSSCVGPASLLYAINCTLTASVGFTAAPVGGSTVGRLSGISCVVNNISTGCTATIGGSVPLSYTNPTVSTPSVLTTQVAGQAISALTTTCGGTTTGPLQLGTPIGTGTTVTNQPFTFTGASSGHPFLS